MVARMALTAAAIALLLLLAAAYGVLHYMTGVPGRSHSGPLPALTDDERALAVVLKRHIETIAAREHNLRRYDELEKAARYIEATLASYGYSVGKQEFFFDDNAVRNIDVVIEPRADMSDPEVIVVGAHYDSVVGSPGANDNGSGTAAVIELARLLRDRAGTGSKRIRLVLFVNEEPPYFKTEDMGSLRYARALSERKERVVAMYSLETIGFYSSAPGSQSYPAPFSLIFPDRGDFVAFVSTTYARALVWETIRSFRSHTSFPSIGGVAPDIVPGMDWSDHWSFEQFGFPAMMVTDTAPFRYPHYHQASDTPDKVDNEKLARVVKGIERVIRDLVR
jgi:peptidase M28-like protein